MAMTLMVENIHNDISLEPLVLSERPVSSSYYKFYQTKLRQLLTQTRYRKEQEARIARQKQLKNQSIQNRLSEQRLHKEYMNYIRERSRIQSQEILKNQNDDQGKRSESVLSNSNGTISLSITPTNMSTIIESRTKIIVKPKPKSILTKPERIISTPISSPKTINRPKIIPTIKIDHVDENLSKANIHSFTQVTSSSQNHHNNKHQHTQQSILNTIMLHLNSYKSYDDDDDEFPTYEDIDKKFSASISPTVYQSFERVVF